MNKQQMTGIFKWGIVVSLTVCGASYAQNKNLEQQIRQEDKRLWILEKLKTAKPAPIPAVIPYTDAETSSAGQNAIIGHDLNTGQDTQSAPRFPELNQLTAPPDAGAGKPGQMSVPSGQGGNNSHRPQNSKKPGTKPGSSSITPLKAGGRQADIIVADSTPPTLLLETTTIPWNTTHKLLMEFYSSTDAQYYYYVCTGWATGSFHIATAGHCVYNHDPNNDSNTSDASWATQVWTWAAQTDRVDPFAEGDFPYGVAMSTYLRSYTGWTSSVNFDHDWALVTLDRRQGDHTGWIGRESGVTAGSLDFTGYPVETPYVPAGSLGQYYGNANILAYTSGRIQLDAFIYGGHSGGPSWRFDGVDYWAQGIHSTSNRVGYAEDTLLTSAKLSDINTWMTEDETARAPTAQPNLIEHWFDINAKDIVTNNVAPGDLMMVEYNVSNAGFAPAANVRLDFYLSTDTFISVADIFIGSLTYANISEWNFINASASFQVPVSTATGNYYVGWLLSTDTTEYNTDDNHVVITSEQVTVANQVCAADAFEPDNSSGAAKNIALNSNQTHNICPVADEDWVSFTLAADSQVVLETSGVSGDTRMWLYNASLGQVEYNDDGGAGFFSYIDRICDTDSLPAGTYFVKVDEFGGNDEIDPYNLSMTATACSAIGPDIRVEPLDIVFDSTTVAAPATVTAAATATRQVNTDRPDQLQARKIRFNRGLIDPADTNNRVYMPQPTADGRRHMLMQFETLPDAEEKAALASQGIRLLSYVPDQTYWVSLDKNASHPASVTAAGGVRWAWVPDPVYKVSKRIDSVSFPFNAVHGDGTFSVQVLLFEDTDMRRAMADIDALGGGIQVVRPTGAQLLEVRSPINRIAEIADMDTVRWVEPANPPRVEENVVAASRITADVLRTAPYNVDGSPLTVGIWDGGAVDAHPDFDIRLTVVDLVGISDHSTHVAGTVGGSGAGNAGATGMAPAVQLRSYDWTSDTTEMRNAATADSVVISNHSYGFATGWTWNGSSWTDYGTGGFGLYDSNSVAYDDLVYDTGLLVFKSAGNDRNDGPDCPAGPRCDGPYETIGYVGNAKNIITVCALSDTDTMSDFSSWGPSDDGRIKPDLCANGVGLLSTLPGNSYASYSGTSMSSPSSAGAAALIFEHFRNHLTTDPDPALMKALMIHAANDLGTSGPDYQYGWGIIDAQTTANLITARAFTEGVISATGAQQDYTFDVTAGSDIKVTMVWTDPAGNPAAASDLINDLDLVLIAPDGTTLHYPWILNGASPSLPAGTGANHVDNVEQVIATAATGGTWTARISGFAVPSGPQAFALVSEHVQSGSTQIITIYNDGTTQLSVSDIVPETTAPWLSISPTALSIPPGESRSVLVGVDFAQAPGGTSVNRLLVYSDDPDENPYPGGVNVTVITEACVDTDNDGVCDTVDVCPLVADPGQADSDNNGTGDACQVGITGIWPATAAVGETVSVFVFGSNFTTDGSTQVYMNGNLQLLVSPVSPEMLIVRVTVAPQHYGPITVTTPSDSETSTAEFGTAPAGLSITGIWPNTAKTGVYSSIFIFGSEFTLDGTTEVYFNGIRQFVVAPITTEMLIVRVLGASNLSGPVQIITPAGNVTSTENLTFVP